MSDIRCSTCDQPAAYVIESANESKGNKACGRCLRSFWPFDAASARPLRS